MIEYRHSVDDVQGVRYHQFGVRVGKLFAGGFYPMCVNNGTYRRSIWNPSGWDHFVFLRKTPYGMHLRVLWFAVGWQFQQAPAWMQRGRVVPPLFSRTDEQASK